MSHETRKALLIQVGCDSAGCSARSSGFAMSEAPFWAERRREGWYFSLSPWRDYCPTHAGEASA